MRATLAAVLALLSAFLANPIGAADRNCPPFPKLTCDEAGKSYYLDFTTAD